MSRIRKSVVPFRWSTITANFTNGTASSLDISGFLSNPQGRTITYAMVGTPPTGVTFSGSTLSYNGTGAVATGSVSFTATSAGYVATSAATTITIAAAPPVNRAPVWSGSDPIALGSFINDQTRTVALAPYASDPDGNTLTFSRVGGTAPAGVVVNGATGVLTIPLGTTVGSYTVTIRASDGALSADRTFSLTVQASSAAGQATISWTAPSTNSAGQSFDGSTLDRTLAGYRIYFGTNRTYVATGASAYVYPVTSPYVFTGLASGTWYFRVVAVDGHGDVSITPDTNPADGLMDTVSKVVT